VKGYLIVVMILVACLSGVAIYLDHQRGVDQARREAKILGAFMTNETNSKALKELLPILSRKIFQTGQDSAQSWVKQFYNSFSVQVSDMAKLSQAGMELADVLSLRWSPFYFYVLHYIDAVADSMAKEEPDIKIEKLDLDIVIANNFAGVNEMIRRITFPNGNNLMVKLNPGKIERGTITAYPKMDFYEIVNGQYSKVAFFIKFTEQSTMIAPNSNNIKYVTWLKEHSTEIEPLKDEELKARFVEAIQKTIRHLYIN
jgi:hypothetical protein